MLKGIWEQSSSGWRVLSVQVYVLLAISILLTSCATKPAMLKSSVGQLESLSGTTWIVDGSNGDRDMMTFRDDGVIFEVRKTGLKTTNGRWSQNSVNLYFQFNNKFVEYVGVMSGRSIEGTAKNTKGEEWTWTGKPK